MRRLTDRLIASFSRKKFPANFEETCISVLTGSWVFFLFLISFFSNDLSFPIIFIFLLSGKLFSFSCFNFLLLGELISTLFTHSSTPFERGIIVAASPEAANAFFHDTIVQNFSPLQSFEYFFLSRTKG